MCRVIGRSKLTKTHMFERLPKSLGVSENIESSAKIKATLILVGTAIGRSKLRKTHILKVKQI